ncbi:MAG: hypothetical protein IT325_09920 [Anaerolineae bacterium]|nr:hypothetical protein [Anaerolineae bacterium]
MSYAIPPLRAWQSGSQSFWNRRLFWSEEEYEAAPGRNKTLLDAAVMSALGFTSSGGANGTAVDSSGNLVAASAPRITHERGATHCLTQWTSSLAQLYPALVTTAGQFKSPDGLATLQLATSPVSYFNLNAGFTALSNTCTLVAYIKRGSFDYDAASKYGFYNSATSLDIGYAAPNYSTGKIEAIQSLAGTITARTEPMGNGVFKLIVTATGGMSAGDPCLVYAGATGGVVGPGHQHWTSACHVNDGPLPLPFLNTFDTRPLFSAGTPMRQNLFATTDLTNLTQFGRNGVTPSALGAVGPGGAPAYRLTKDDALGSRSLWAHNDTLPSLVAGCVNTLYLALRGGTIADVGMLSNAGWSAVRAEIVSGPGTVNSNALPRIDGLQSGQWTIVRIRNVPADLVSWGGLYIYPGGAGPDGAGSYIDVSTVMLHEGTADLSFEPDPISVYPQAALLIEPARTRETLYPRDLTQAAWVKNNMTATKTAVGTDGVANSASTLTASASNGTCLQSVTSASANRAFGPHIRSRSAASLILDLTCDGGTTWQAVTANAAWMPYSALKASVTNPSYGFRLRSSGDSIDVDWAQGEIGDFATSPIGGTESAAQTRSVDTIGTPADWISDAAGTVAATFVAPIDVSGYPAVVGTPGSAMPVYVSATRAVGIFDGLSLAGAVATVAGNVYRAASNWGTGVIGISVDGLPVNSDVYDGTMGSSLYLGRTGGGNILGSGILALELSGTKATDAQLQLASQGLLP